LSASFAKGPTPGKTKNLIVPRQLTAGGTGKRPTREEKIISCAGLRGLETAEKKSQQQPEKRR